MTLQPRHSALPSQQSEPPPVEQPAVPESAPALTPFDYSALPSDHAELARDAAEAIRTSHKRIGGYILAIGEKLSSVKELLDHGQFGAWIDAKFSWDIRTAQRYMSAWAAFGDKTDIVSHLPPTLIYELSSKSTPPAIRDQVIEGIKAGERVEPAAIKDMITEARSQARIEAQEAKLSADERKRREQAAARRKRREEQLEREIKETREQLERLRQDANMVAEIIATSLGCRPFFDVMSTVTKYQAEHRFGYELGRALHSALIEESREPGREGFQLREESHRQKHSSTL